MASINYEDERFSNLTTEKENAISQSNTMYDNLIKDSSGYYDNLINQSKEWADKQAEIQNQQTQFTTDKIEQQKEQANKDYIKEQTGAYVDWQKQSNQYGANAETMASQGLNNTGYSESSQVSMYNTYQNRVAQARESYNNIVLNYNNNIKEAELQNSSALAQIYADAQQQQLELALENFSVIKDLKLNKQNAYLNLDSEYNNRWKDVESQINTENALAEEIRQYNESLAEEKRQADLDNEYRLKALAQEQAQWEKEYNLSLANSYRSGGSSSSSGGSSGNTITTAYYSGKLPSATSNAISSYGTFSNGYQPKGIVGYGTVSKTGETTKVVSTTLQGTKTVTTQNVWETSDGTKWVWNGMSMKYEKYS